MGSQLHQASSGKGKYGETVLSVHVATLRRPQLSCLQCC